MSFEIISFMIKDDNDNEESLKKLNSLLGTFNVKAKIWNRENISSLQIYYDTDEVEKCASRNAGAKEIRYDETLTVEDVQSMIKEMGADKAAAKLGMTKQGMYARIRRRNKKGLTLF